MSSSKKKNKFKPAATQIQQLDSVNTESKKQGHKKETSVKIQLSLFDPSQPLLPGSRKTNTGIFFLLILATLLLYAGDLNLGFFSVDDSGYVTDNPWIKEVSMKNLQFILTTPYFTNYSPLHILSYSVDYSIAGQNAFVFHLSSNIWAGLVAGFVFLVALALTRRQFVAIAAAVLFVVHPAHVEAIVWISSRKDLIAAAFALPSLLAYIKYRKGGKFYLWWYILSLLLFIFALAGKLSVATFPAVLLALDYFVEKRPIVKSLIDKLPFLLAGIGFAIIVASAQPLSGNSPDPYVYMTALGQSIWLLTGFGSYVIYRVPPVASQTGLDLVAALILIAAFALPFLLRRLMPIAVVLFYWILFAFLPAQILSFIHPVTDRYLFFPSVAAVILIAWGVNTVCERVMRKGIVLSSIILFTIAFFWGMGTLNYLSDWRDPLSVWSGSLKKSKDPDVYSSLGTHYLNLSGKFGNAVRDSSLSENSARQIANSVWKDDKRLQQMLTDWSQGKWGGAAEKEFQAHLSNLASGYFEKTIQVKGSRVLPHLYFRKGIISLNKGDLAGARKEFLATLEEASLYSVIDVRSEIRVATYTNLGMLAGKENNFREALTWYKKAEDEQTMAGGNWVKDISASRKKMEATVAMLSGGAGTDGKTDNPEVAYSLGLYYLNAADRLGATPKGTWLPVEEAKQIANEVWKNNSQLNNLLSEWNSGNRGGPVEKIFQNHLKQSAWQAFEKAVQIKGNAVMSQLFFRRGMILGELGKIIEARKEFMTALDEASRDSVLNNRQQVIVLSHDALGVLAWRSGDYKEALKWFKVAEEDQVLFGKIWVTDFKSKQQRMESLIATKPSQ